ncbi:iap-2 [Malacosoma neustria nucleopolyhedrovirus]|uniref:iap-2 n=1 Tax=Malacosoma neustria nuclear polyhedrosis virus TaxID=38012 RepID=UPI000E3580E8|nr:iap-2 [Malacosoma neustria nucleopolyhedrovirus]AUF81579.1 iap-2 [Malacosoma neustria nucleopolyhedrovirus]
MDVGDLYNKIINKDLAPPKVYYDVSYRYESFNSINISSKVKTKLSQCGLYYDINAKKFVCVFCNMNTKRLSKKSINAHTFSRSCPMSLQLLSTNPSLRKSSFGQYRRRGAIFGNIKHENELVKNGFFYTGKREEMCCVHCGLIIVKLHDDDCIDSIHKMYSPQCIFVIRPSAPPLEEPLFVKKIKTVRIDHLDKNTKYIVDISNCSVSDNNIVSNNNDDDANADTVAVNDDNNEHNDKYDDENNVNDNSNRDGEERLCKICFVNNRQICFFPCRHIMTCSQCADRCKRCCVCREKIKSKIFVYLQ